MRSFKEYKGKVTEDIGVFQLETDGYWRILINESVNSNDKKLHFEYSETFLVYFLGEPVDKNLVNLYLAKGVSFAINKSDFFFHTKNDATNGLDILLDYGYSKLLSDKIV